MRKAWWATELLLAGHKFDMPALDSNIILKDYKFQYKLLYRYIKIQSNCLGTKSDFLMYVQHNTGKSFLIPHIIEYLLLSGETGI